MVAEDEGYKPSAGLNPKADSEKCRSCNYLTLPIRGLQKHPRCLLNQDPEICKVPFLFSPDQLGKILQRVCEEICIKIRREHEVL
jgi:hypothetical protein